MGARNKSKYDGKFITGTRYGKWTVVDGIIHMRGSSRSRRANILLKCECGTEAFVDVWSLLNNKTSCCSTCGTRHIADSNPNWKGAGELSASYFNNDRKIASYHNLSFTATPQQLFDQFVAQAGSCSVTNMPISLNSATARLDRIDKTRGYEANNVRWVHSAIYPVLNNAKISQPENIFTQLGFNRGTTYEKNQKTNSGEEGINTEIK